MNAHAVRPASSCFGPLGKFARWVNTRWHARRARLREEDALLYLSELEPRLLNDIGVNFNRLSGCVPTSTHHDLQWIILPPLPPAERRSSRRRKS
jgi:hypothetical protein